MKNRSFMIGAMVMLVAILTMGAALTDNAIWNKVFDSTENAIQVDVVHDTFSGDVAISGTLSVSVCNAVANDTTPSIANCQILQFVANSGATAITDLDDPVVGSVIVLVGTSATNAPTIADSGNFALSTAWTGTVDETLTLYVQADNDYVELARSAN